MLVVFGVDVVLTLVVVFYQSLQYVYFVLILTVTVRGRTLLACRQAAVTCSIQQGEVRTNVWIH